MTEGRPCRQRSRARLPLGLQGSRRQPLDGDPRLAAQADPSAGKFLPGAAVPSPASEGLNQVNLVSSGEVPGAERGVNDSRGRFLPLWDPRVPQSATVSLCSF